MQGHAEVEFSMGFKLPSLPNTRMHHMARARMMKSQREAVGLFLCAKARAFRSAWERDSQDKTLRLVAALTRAGPKRLDDDNVVGAFKAMRD